MRRERFASFACAAMKIVRSGPSILTSPPQQVANLHPVQRPHDEHRQVALPQGRPRPLLERLLPHQRRPRRLLEVVPRRRTTRQKDHVQRRAGRNRPQPSQGEAHWAGEAEVEATMDAVKAASPFQVSGDMNRSGRAPRARPQHCQKVLGIGWPWWLPTIATTPHADGDNSMADLNHRSKASL